MHILERNAPIKRLILAGFKIAQRIQRKELMLLKRTQFITAEEVAATMGVSQSKAYQIVRTLNRELKAMAFITIAGMCPVKYFEKRCYGVQADESSMKAE